MYIAEWGNDEKTIIKQIITGPLLTEEMKQGFVKLWSYLDSVEHDVFMVTTVDDWIWLPKEFGSIVRDYDRQFRENLVLHVIIGNSLTLRIAMNLASIVAPRSFKRSRIVKTEEEAYRLIAKYQQGIAI